MNMLKLKYSKILENIRIVNIGTSLQSEYFKFNIIFLVIPLQSRETIILSIKLNKDV